jgi:tetratricopeptide (TPR) repeat protein
MATPFLSSEEFDERAHRLYDDGEYDSALETLREGLKLYPHSVELYVGLGYTRLAREEYVWARQAFERGLVLDPEHEDALVGLGEALLRFGDRREALRLFRKARATGTEDLDLLLSMGRALYREQLYEEAEDVFRYAAGLHGGSPDAVAGLGYTLHRRGDEQAACGALRRALQLDAAYHEARVYIGHLLYDRGEWAGALREFERVPPGEHWDTLAVERLIELRRALQGIGADGPDLDVWIGRLRELEANADPLDEVLLEVEAGLPALEDDPPPHRVRLPGGVLLSGSWYEIVRRIRDACGAHREESVAQFMRRCSDEERARSGYPLPTEDPGSFVSEGARAGLWQIER